MSQANKGGNVLTDLAQRKRRSTSETVVRSEGLLEERASLLSDPPGVYGLRIQCSTDSCTALELIIRADRGYSGVGGGKVVSFRAVWVRRVEPVHLRSPRNRQSDGWNVRELRRYSAEISEQGAVASRFALDV